MEPSNPDDEWDATPSASSARGSITDPNLNLRFSQLRLRSLLPETSNLRQLLRNEIRNSNNQSRMRHAVRTALELATSKRSK